MLDAPVTSFPVGAITTSAIAPYSTAGQQARRGAAARERPDRGARGQAGQPGRLLLLGARQPDRLGRQHGAPPRPRRHARAQRTRDDLRLDQAQTQPVELLGHGDRQPALLAGGLPQGGRVAVGGCVLHDAVHGGQVEPFREVAAHGGAELLLVVGECEEHLGPLSRQAEHALGGDVALDLAGAAPDRDRPGPHGLGVQRPYVDTIHLIEGGVLAEQVVEDLPEVLRVRGTRPGSRSLPRTAIFETACG